MRDAWADSPGRFGVVRAVPDRQIADALMPVPAGVSGTDPCCPGTVGVRLSKWIKRQVGRMCWLARYGGPDSCFQRS